MEWEEFWSKLANACISVAWKLLWAVIALAIGTLIIKLVIKYFPKGAKKHPIDATVRGFLISATKFVLYIIVMVIVIGILGVPLASVITVIAAAGAAIALALQGSLANIAGGIMLLIFKPLKIGDYVEAGSVAGTVADVGLYYTTLITPDNKRIELPNSTLTTNSIVNYSSEKTRRVDLAFPVAYETDVERAKALILAKIQEHDRILSDPAPLVRMTSLDDSSVNITVRVWCASPDYWNVKFDLTEQVKELLDRNNINIPFKQIDVHMK